MSVALVVVTTLLVLILLFSAGAKLARSAHVVNTMARVGVPQRMLPRLAIVEIAGAAGLAAGFSWWPIGVAAAIGVVLYFAGAVVSHVRVNDTKNLSPAAVMAALAVGELVLLIARF
jgi:uncharacterized membrane protein